MEAQKAATGGGPMRDTYERIAKRRGRKIAKVAVARKILTLCFYGLRDGEIRCLARRAPAERDSCHGDAMTVRRPVGCPAGPGRDAAARASSPFVMASPTTGRPTS